MPEWDQDINDVGDCVDKYGRLYALYSIASAAETSPLKIRLGAKKWFGYKEDIKKDMGHHYMALLRKVKEELVYRKRMKELKKRDPFIYK